MGNLVERSKLCRHRSLLFGHAQITQSGHIQETMYPSRYRRLLHASKRVDICNKVIVHTSQREIKGEDASDKHLEKPGAAARGIIC